jgi:hypothetical protein
MSRLTAWKRWQAAAGPWRGWAVCPALTMPVGVVDDLSGTACHSTVDIAELAQSLRLGEAAVVLDLEPVLGVRLAAELSRQQLAHVVLALPRWPHADAVLATDRLASTLVATAARLSAGGDRSNVVFVLDGERQTSLRRPLKDRRVDNRYALSLADLPNIATLRGAGIRRLLKVTHQR